MKFSSLTLLSLLLSASMSSFAQDCIQQICVGKTIIDSSDRVGTVVKIVDQTVNYSANGYSLSSSASALSNEIESIDEIKKGNNVIDSSDRVGAVMNVFANKKVRYNANGYTLVGSEVSPQVAEFKGIKVGTVVIDASDRVGTTMNPFKDGRVRYNANGYSLVSKNIFKEVAEFNGISKNKIVIDSSDRVGQVAVVFEDGRVRYVANGYHLTSNNLAPEIDGIGLIKKGNLVIDSSDRIGSVLYVFRDSKVRYSANGYNLTSKQVSPQTDKIGEDKDLFKGVVVLDSSERVGTISYVFEDGRVNYSVNGYSLISSSLSPEVKTHNEYNKESFYSDSGYNVGKISLFFKNGKIRLVSVDGYSYIRTELFNKVDSLGNFTEGTSVTEPSGYTGLIKMVFENGAALYEVEKPVRDWQGHETTETKKYDLSAKIFGIDVGTLEEDRKEWITSVADEIRSGYFLAGGLVVEASKYVDLKKELIQYLKDHPDFIYDQKTRDAVNVFLNK